jgi:predicted acylesterase/phospholipase RssA
VEEYPPDVWIRPSIPPEVTLFSGFHLAAAAIAAGEHAAKEALPHIQALLPARTRAK